MAQLFRKTPPPIGLDLGAESIKLLQLAATPGGGLRVAAALRVMVPDDVKGDPDRRVAFAGQTVRAALRQGAFTGTRVVAALPKELVHYRTHRLSPMSADEVAVAARIDARDLFRFDPDSADVQCIDAGEILQGLDRRREVILVAAGKQYISDFVLALDGAGARVASLEIDPCALWRAAARAEPDDHAGGLRVLLDVGAAQSRLVIGRGDAIRVVKTIAVGAGHLRDAVTRKLGLSAAEAEQLRRRSSAAGSDKLDAVRKMLNEATRHVTDLLAREVLAGVRYHAVTFRGPAPRRIELVGGNAGDPQVRSTLSAALLLPAKPADMFRGIDTSAVAAAAADRTPHLGEWVVALGLALKGLPAVGRLAAQPADAPPLVGPAAPVGNLDERQDESVVARARRGASHRLNAGGGVA